MCMRVTRPVPLMFIKSPQAAVRLPDNQEENVEVLAQEASSKEIKKPEVDETEKKEVNGIVAEQLKKIQTPFGRHLYQPLLFKLTNQTEILGTLKEVEGNEIFILEEGNEEKTITIQNHELMDILWRGKSMGEQ